MCLSLILRTSAPVVKSCSHGRTKREVRCFFYRWGNRDWADSCSHSRTRREVACSFYGWGTETGQARQLSQVLIVTVCGVRAWVHSFMVTQRWICWVITTAAQHGTRPRTRPCSESSTRWMRKWKKPMAKPLGTPQMTTVHGYECEGDFCFVLKPEQIAFHPVFL